MDRKGKTNGLHGLSYQSDREASPDGGQRRDPDRALIRERRLWRRQDCCAQGCRSACISGRGRHRSAGNGHKCAEERARAQQHSTGQHQRASHGPIDDLWEVFFKKRAAAADIWPIAHAHTTRELFLQLCNRTHTLGAEPNPMDSAKLA